MPLFGTCVSRRLLLEVTSVPREENGPVPRQEEFGSGQSKLADVHRPSDESFDRGMKSHFEQLEKKLDDFKELMRLLEQQLTSQEQDARQPRLAMEADGPANTRTRERTEGAATAVQAMRGDSFSARRVLPDPNTNSTSFGVKAEPPALPCRDDVVVENGDAAPESCLSSLEMRSSTVSRWWLISHRQNLRSNEDHRQRATSSVLLDQGGELEEEKSKDFDSIRLIRQQCLPKE